MGSSSPGKTYPIFVLGFHRGGTTLVQRLLNCHEKVTVWGENGGIISDLQAMYELHTKSPLAKIDARKYQEFDEFTKKFLPWATPFDSDQLAAHIAAMLESLYRNPTDPSSFWGFKEIRHGALDDIDFLYRLFPHCRMVLIVRHPKDLLLSQYFSKWGEKHFSPSPEKGIHRFIANYAKSVESYLEISEQKPCHAKIFRYESISLDTVSNDLFGFLGLPEPGIRHRLLNEVIHARVGSSFKDKGRTVDASEDQLFRKLCDKLINAVLRDVASARAFNAIQNWYPSLGKNL